jgi:phosphatidylserine/phosphatidylglycerophosphate/cardiolipin synthase-like enzyme
MLTSLLVLAAQADDVSLVLHDPGAQRAPSPRCTVPVCTSLRDLIDRSAGELGFAFYGFREQPDLLAAFIRARDRGVAVRGVVDLDVAGANYYSSTEAFRSALVQVRDDHAADLLTAGASRPFYGPRDRCPRPPGTRGPLQCLAFDLGDRCYLTAHAAREPIVFTGDIMHDKFLVVDRRYVWTGSTNASDSCAGGYNANLVMVVDSPRVASWYQNELDQMYRGRFHRQKESAGVKRVALGPDLTVEVLFSPQDHPIDRGVLPVLSAAQRTIDVAVFFLTHKGLAQALIDAHHRGVSVRVLLDASGAANEYSKHEVLRAAGIPVRIENFGGKLHAKAVAVDGHVVVGGSMNWTNAGDGDNDENTIIVRSARIWAVYREWFDALWQRIGPRWELGRPDPESADSTGSCADGVDNDYDGLVDRLDPGCTADRPPVPPPFPAWIVPTVEGRCDWSLGPAGAQP